MSLKKVSLPNLNGLRFLAALGVAVHHVEQIKQRFGFVNHWDNDAVLQLGGRCVSLFFVLSGFLITFLLLTELGDYGSISVTKFYLRRVLRIWPLYFFLCALCFLILPCFRFFDLPNSPPPWGPGWGAQAAAYLLMSPQVATAWRFADMPFVGVLWSVGVEEWFYAFWPWIIKYVRHRLLFILLAIVIIMPVSRMIADRLFHSVSFWWLFDMTRFDCMAMGGLFALLLHVRHAPGPRRLLALLFRPDVQLGLYLYIFYAMTNGLIYGWVDHTVYAFLYGAAILNLAGNPQSILRLEHPLMHWLGNLSYGMYCYNWITTTSACKLTLLVWPGNHPHSVSLSLLVDALSLGLLFVAAGLSYEFFERRFLLLKQRPAFSRLSTLPPTDLKSAVTNRPA